MSNSAKGTIVSGFHDPIEFSVDQHKWERFIAAAEVIGKSPEKLIAEAVDLCADTAIAMATLLGKASD